eukprot:2808991-Pyramimonas_sp.AAC.1
MPVPKGAASHGTGHGVIGLKFDCFRTNRTDVDGIAEVRYRFKASRADDIAIAIRDQCRSQRFQCDFNAILNDFNAISTQFSTISMQFQRRSQRFQCDFNA